MAWHGMAWHGSMWQDSTMRWRRHGSEYVCMAAWKLEAAAAEAAAAAAWPGRGTACQSVM